MGEKTKETLKLRFDKRLRLEFHGARTTSGAELHRRIGGQCAMDILSVIKAMRYPHTSSRVKMGNPK